jgi:hypothetical protein
VVVSDFKENLNRKQYQKTGIEELLYQFTERETGNNVEIIEESRCCVKH